MLKASKFNLFLFISLITNLFSISAYANEENNLLKSENLTADNTKFWEFENNKKGQKETIETNLNPSETWQLKADSLGKPLFIQEVNKTDFFANQPLTNIQAQSQPNQPENKNWQFEIAPYGFLPLNISGDSTVNGLTADVDMDLGNVFDLLQFIASARFEAWYQNKYGIIFDGYYVSLGLNGSRVRDNAGFFDSRTSRITGDIRFKQGLFDLGFGYRTEINKPQNYFDFIGGIRLQYLEESLKIDGEFTNNFIDVNRSRRFGGDSTWVEPFLSTRINYGVSNNVSLGGRFDISGFGIGDLSTTWKLLGGVDWYVTDSIALNFDYSVFSIDYSTGSGNQKLGIDQVQHGPIIGITFNF